MIKPVSEIKLIIILTDDVFRIGVENGGKDSGGC